MKKTLKYIFFICFFLKSWSVLAVPGEVILDLKPEPEFERIPAADKENFAQKQVEKFFVRYQNFEEKFPGEEIDGDISAEVALVYPYLSFEEQQSKMEDIRFAIKSYRFFKNLYEEVKEKMLVPEPPPLVVAEEDYDKPYREDYIYSTDPVIINDFKKVLSYGTDKRDFEAMELKAQKKSTGEASSIQGFAKLGELFGKLELKKLFFYGMEYADPFSGNSGIGAWEGSSVGRARLISAEKDIHNPNIRAAIHFSLNPGQMLLWSPEKKLLEPTFDFSGSVNVEKVSVILPMPQRVVDNTSDNILGYSASFAVPVEISLKDIQQPVELKAVVKANVCGENKCESVSFEPYLKMEVGDGEYGSAVATFVNKSFAELPKAQLPDLKIIKAVVDAPYKKGENNVLRVVLKADYKPDKVSVFIKNKAGIEFYRPKVTINESTITARFQARDKNADLADKKYEISAQFDSMTSLRTEVTSRAASLFDLERQELSLVMILLAVLGGFILNFMPCVFPVLSLKFLSLTKFGAMNPKTIRKGFAYTALGVGVAFSLLVLVLLLLKWGDYAIGWGMQFQNPYFIVAIMFVMVLFLAQIFNLLDIKTPQFIVKKLSENDGSDTLLHFLTGLFLVLVATPCTAPYLGTTLGFALAGSYLDIIVILYAVGLGLALPYLLLAASPNLGLYMPKPGPWMEKLNTFMASMLFLTILWLGSVLYAQTSLATALKLGGLLLAFLLLLYMRHLILDKVELQPETIETREKAAKLVKKTALVLSLILLSSSLYLAARGYEARQIDVKLNRTLKLDKAEIDTYLKEGKIVIVKVGADWCLTCKFNDVTVFNTPNFISNLEYYKVKLIEVDWTSYDKDILAFMKEFGRSGLPFYMLFSREIPDGMVLPEVLTENELVRLIRSFGN